MKTFNSLYSSIIVLSLVILALSATLPLCSAADSPKYIWNLFAVDPTGNSLTSINPVINPNTNRIATIAIAVTKQIPQGLQVTEDGFSNPTLGIDSVNIVSGATVQNQNGSTTTKYLLQLPVPDTAYPSPIVFTYFVNVVEQPNNPPVNHNATIQFTVNTPSATPTASPTSSPSPEPTASVTPSPSVPEFPVWIITVIGITSTSVAVVFIKRKPKGN